MKVIRFFTIASFMAAFSLTVNAQDVQFSQFYETPMWRNPSLMGHFKGDFQVKANYRSQWGSVTTPFQTVSASGEYKQLVGGKNDFVTIGLQLLNDRAGQAALTQTHIYPAVAYHKSLNGERNRYLTVGFMGGMVNRRFDISKATTNAQYDGTPNEDFNNNSLTYWDGSVGLTYNSSIGPFEEDNFYIGAAYHHFNTPKNSFYKVDSIEVKGRLTFSAGVRYSITDYSYFTVEGDYSMQGSFSQLTIGGLYTTKFGSDFANPDYALHFGGFVRFNDAFIPVVKLDYRSIQIGLSYDANISQLRTASMSRGGFELSLGYRGFLSSYSLVKDATLQPRF